MVTFMKGFIEKSLIEFLITAAGKEVDPSA